MNPLLRSLIVVLIAIFTAIGCEPLDKRLRGIYPLPNGYEYTNYNGMHFIEKEEHKALYLGSFLNRIYVDDKYVVGEVALKHGCSEDETQSMACEMSIRHFPKGCSELEKEPYCYFVLDTENGDYTSKLNRQEFEIKLKEIGICQNVELVARREKNWWQPK